MYAYFAHLHVWAPYAHVAFKEMKRRHSIIWNRVTSVCEPLCGYWDLTLSHLQERQVLLTSKPSFQPVYETLSVLGKS